MAIENVLMMNVVGKRANVDAFTHDMLQFRELQPVDTMSEIEAGRFTLPIHRKNLGKLLGFTDLIPGKDLADEKTIEEKIKRLHALYDGSLQYDPAKRTKERMDLKRALAHEKGYEAYVQSKYSDLETSKARLERIRAEQDVYHFLAEIDIPVNELMQMTYFSTVIGSISKENAARLKSIYNNVTAVSYHVGNTAENEEVFLIFTPKDLYIETQRILKSLNFKPLSGIDLDDSRKPAEILTALKEEKTILENKISEWDNALLQYREKHRKEAQYTFDALNLYADSFFVQKKMAFSDDHFYFSAWIPESQKENLETLLTEHFKDEVFLVFQENTVGLKKPTRLKNNWFFKPFEQLIAMYGAPSCREIDPTPFLAITYMLCFGYMFGDVGQGLVLMLGGWLASKKLKISLGDVVVRMGMSAVVFGFIYGSVFGNETLLPALWIRPMNDINTALISAVVMGVVMLFGAYIYNILNSAKRKDLKEGLFGPNGLAGLLLYAGILVFALIKLGYLPAPVTVASVLLIFDILMVLFVLFREPLANLIRKRKLYDESASDYYIDAGFGLLEMALSMLSNTVSFIRVGAFALTHAGMFLAFETLSEMVGGGIGGILIMVIGNIFIIVMEGLIDFIQCLRLQFYELFSKYYSGDGEAFTPLDITIRNERAAG